MDFDEYEYLEKAVENPEVQNANGSDEPLTSAKNERCRSSKRINNDDSDLDHCSKRSKPEDDSHFRNHNRERGSSRHRSRSRDREKTNRDGNRHRSSRDRDGEREKEERNDKDRHRNRDNDKDQGRSSERRERYREREKDRERDRDRHNGSHAEKHRENREKSRDRDYRDKERDRDRESRSHKEKKHEAAEPVVDPERDQRTVFAYQIALKADERDVFEFFSRAGKVRDVRLIMDRISRRSRGVGYIEFYDAMSVPMAIALSGQLLLGQPVMVKPSEAEKNMVQSTSSAAGADAYSGGGKRLYVGNLHYNMTEEQLRQVFEPFGTLELIQLPLDDTGHCKGFGFIQFARLDEAQAALNLNGQLDIAGRTIKVSAVTDHNSTQDAGKNTGDLDDDEGGGMHLNAQSRALLMLKLDRTGASTSVVSSLGTTLASNGGLPSAPALGVLPGVPPLAPSIPSLGGLSAPGFSAPPIEAIGVPSECLLLKNMFDPNAESEPDYDLDIKEDVQDECAKFGTLKHIHVEKYSAGFVYLRFENTQSAVNAQRALHGRWFAGKMITATFMLPHDYEAKFPDIRGEATSS